MTEPIEIEFEVACSPAHAFDTWANKTSMWWPSSHSISSAPGLVVTFEPRPGGRIYERTPDGSEHDWGEVLAWEPPQPPRLPLAPGHRPQPGHRGRHLLQRPRRRHHRHHRPPRLGAPRSRRPRLARAQPRRLERPAPPLPRGGRFVGSPPSPERAWPIRALRCRARGTRTRRSQAWLTRTRRGRVPRWGSVAQRGGKGAGLSTAPMGSGGAAVRSPYAVVARISVASTSW